MSAAPSLATAPARRSPKRYAALDATRGANRRYPPSAVTRMMSRPGFDGESRLA